ncbi:MAG: efflux RND transporter periplasmic adaptor subunit [Planctomycetes bacterium]|nr:efflux RND transporter periplasmic adaptor subunit [Planctomycetota bacterium]
MTRRPRKFLNAILPVAVLVAGLVAAKALVDSREEAPHAEPPAAIPFVELAAVRPGTHAVAVHATGTARPAVESELVAEVGGRVIAVGPSLAAGAFFAAGEELLTIDPRDFELAVVEAEAELARARLALELERAEAESARREWQTMQLGGEPSPLVLREPQLRDAEARVAAAEARLEARRRDLERTHVTAPYAGRVVEKLVDLGQFVTRGARLGRIYSIEAAEVRLAVEDDQLAFLAIDLDPLRAAENGATPPVEVVLAAEFGGRHCTWEGTIVRTDSALDERSRMVNLIARVADPYGVLVAGGAERRASLLPGMFVEAAIRGRELRDVLVVDRATLRGGGRELHVVDAALRLWRRPVEVVRIERDRAVIRAPLADGERVCLTRLDAVVDGMRVRTADPADGGAVASTPAVGENR